MRYTYEYWSFENYLNFKDILMFYIILYINGA